MSESSTEDYNANDGDSNSSEGSSVAAPANNDADDAMILDFINQHANYIDVSSASANLDNQVSASVLLWAWVFDLQLATMPPCLQPEEDFNLDLNFDWTTMVNNDMCQPLIDLSEDGLELEEGAEGPATSGRRPIGKNISNQMPGSDVETESETDSEGNASNDAATDSDSSVRICLPLLIVEPIPIDIYPYILFQMATNFHSSLTVRMGTMTRQIRKTGVNRRI